MVLVLDCAYNNDLIQEVQMLQVHTVDMLCNHYPHKMYFLDNLYTFRHWNYQWVDILQVHKGHIHMKNIYHQYKMRLDYHCKRNILEDKVEL